MTIPKTEPTTFTTRQLARMSPTDCPCGSCARRRISRAAYRATPEAKTKRAERYAARKAKRAAGKLAETPIVETSVQDAPVPAKRTRKSVEAEIRSILS